MKRSTKIRIFLLFTLLLFCSLSTWIILACATYLNTQLAIPHPWVYAIGTLFALPCVAIFIIALRFPGIVERDEVFTVTTARTIATIAWIFLILCTLFLGGIVTLFYLGDYLLTSVFALIDLIGIGLGVLLYILADYIHRASILKEEVDSTL